MSAATILSVATRWAYVVRVLATVAALSAPLIIAALTRGRRKTIESLEKKDVVLFRVWRGVYFLGGAVAGFGLFMFVFTILNAHSARHWWLGCGIGAIATALGAFNIYVTQASYVLVGRDWVEIKDVWRVRRWVFADLKSLRRSRSGVLLDDGSKRMHGLTIYANSGALLELLEKRWTDAHPTPALG